MELSRSAVTLAVTVFLVLLGSGLLIAAFCVSPPGEISDSVLVAFGEILAFAGTVFGINYHYKYRVSKTTDV